MKEIHDCTFFQCGSITEFKLPDTLEEIGQYAFSHCGGLKEIVIPKNVKKIGGFAFFFSLGLKSVILPEGLEEIGPLAFSRTWIEDIEIPGTVTRIGYGLFDNCIFIKDIKLSGECKSIYDGAFNGYLGKHTLMLPRREQPVPLLRETWDPSWGILPDYRPPSDIWFWLRHMEKVKHLIIPEFVTELPSYCLHGETLSSVTILGKIEKTGRNVFRNCSHIKYVIAPNTPITKFDRECRNIVFWGYIQAQKKKNIHYPEKIEKTYLKHFENNKERLLADGKNNIAFQEFLSKHEEM